MKIIVAGKGGVGKTTITAALAKLLAEKGFEVLALDTDSVPNLALSLGVPPEDAEKIVPLTENVRLIEERTGARPGEGWGLFFSLTPKVDDIVDRYGVRISDRIRLVVVGGISQGNEGCLCPAIALAKAFLSHVLLREKRIVIVDSEAGAEVFGRGLAEHFDLMIVVCEPSLRSLLIGKRLIELAKDIGVKRFVVAVNKAKDELAARNLYEQVFADENYPLFVAPYDLVLEEYESRGKSVAHLPRNSKLFLALTPLITYIEELARGK